MDDMHSTVFPEIPDKNRLYKPLGLTSAYSEFLSYAMLKPSLNNRISLILYYAHIMDQKKVLYDFYKLCKYDSENKSQRSSSESSINAWIKNSIVKLLHRRREVIISETVSTLQPQFVFAISQVVFGVMCDFLVNLGKNGHISDLNAKRQCHTNWNILFSKSQMLLDATCSNSTPFLFLKESKKMRNPFHCLRSFWLEFCYRPDPTQCIKFMHHFQEELEISKSTQHSSGDSETTNPSSENPKTANSTLPSCDGPKMENATQHSSEDPKAINSTQQFSDDSEGKNSTNPSSENPKAANSTLPSCDGPKMENTTQHSSEDPKAINSTQQSSDDPEGTNSMQQFTEDSETTHSSITFQNNHIMDSTSYPKIDISTQQSDDDQSSLSSESDSDSSGSWSCNDFNDDSISDDDHLCSYTSKNKFLEKCKATMDWLQSPACDFDDCLNFSQALTEENCMGSPSSRGSLNFVDCSDEEDEYEVIFLDGSSDTGFENDAFMDMSQGFENPCFEDSSRVFPATSFIEIVNECWNDDMMELLDKPRKPSRVSFAPEPSLVTVKYFEKAEENTFDASLVLDNLRFRKRITELDYLLSPFLTIEHRMVVQERNCF